MAVGNVIRPDSRIFDDTRTRTFFFEQLADDIDANTLAAENSAIAAQASADAAQGSADTAQGTASTAQTSATAADTKAVAAQSDLDSHKTATASTSSIGHVKQATAIADLAQTITNPPTQAEVQAISNKMDALLAVLRTSGALA